MEDRYFHASRSDAGVRTAGVSDCLLGHRLEYDPCRRADGIFSQWTWDGARLSVRNDRYGFYPLFYYCGRGEIGISPSLTRLLELGAAPALDAPALAVFLRLGFFIGDDTPFRHIRALPPGATLEWDGRGGPATILSDGYVLKAPCSAISRDEAIDAYIALFRQSIRRRLPADRQFAVPLSGGRDSRHILLELHHQGRDPALCVTSRHYPPRPDEDARIASLLMRELNLPHRILEQEESLFKAEFRKNLATGLCSDEHAWFLQTADFFSANYRTLYDGIAGDVLSAGLFLSPERLKLFESGKTGNIADELLRNQNEGTLRSLLTPQAYSSVGRELAIEHLQPEIEKHLHAANPVGSFFFWNRTRREIALAPYRLLDALPEVFAPYLDHDLYDFLASLPAGLLLDHALHTDAVRRAYPQFAHIPFEDKNTSAVEPFEVHARLGRELAWHLLPRMPSRMMRNGFLLPRLLASVFSRRFSASTSWFAPWALYFHQLESLSSDTRRP